jgi:hypothetical protein
MMIETVVRNTQQTSIKAILLHPSLTTANEKDRVALGVEGEGEAPHSTVCIKAQLFHVDVARTFERIDLWPA